MIVNKFGIFALLVVLLSISGGECRRRYSSGFSGGVSGGTILGRAISARIAKPKPKDDITYLYQSYAPQPMDGRTPAGQQITQIQEKMVQSALGTMNAAAGNATGITLQTKPAYPGQAPVAVVSKPNSAKAIIFYPCFYGIVGMVTYFFGKGYRLIL